MTKDNVKTIDRGGRARWKIENETFKKAFSAMREAPSYFWERVLSIFKFAVVDSWEMIFSAMGGKEDGQI